MRMFLLTLLAWCIARSPLWVCRCVRAWPLLVWIGVSFMVWMFVLPRGNDTTSVLMAFIWSLIEAFSAIAVLTYTILHATPVAYRLVPAAKIFSRMLPDTVSWTFRTGHHFDDSMSAHARAQFFQVKDQPLYQLAHDGIERACGEIFGTEFAPRSPPTAITLDCTIQFQPDAPRAPRAPTRPRRGLSTRMNPIMSWLPSALHRVFPKPVGFWSVSRITPLFSFTRTDLATWSKARW